MKTLEPLSGMKNLRELSVTYSPLERLPTNLPGLDRLDVTATKVRSIAAISSIHNLKKLLVDSPIEDFSPLHSLRALRWFWCLTPTFTDATLLSKLKLEYLNLDCKGIKDLAPILSIRALGDGEWLRLKRVRRSDPMLGELGRRFPKASIQCIK